MSYFQDFIDWIFYLFTDAPSSVGTRSQSESVKRTQAYCHAELQIPKFDCHLKHGKNQNQASTTLDEKLITTHFVANISPPQSTNEADVVKVEYRRRAKDKVEQFFITGSLKSILPGCDGPSNEQEYDEDLDGQNKMKQVEVFFNALIYIIRNLRCKIWCNGYLMELEPYIDHRLDIIRFEIEPFRFIFHVANLSNLRIARANDSIICIGKDRFKNKLKFLIIHSRGGNVAQVSMMLPKNGTLIVNFPPYNRQNQPLNV